MGQARAFSTVAGEQVITRAICRKPTPSSAILRHRSIWSGEGDNDSIAKLDPGHEVELAGRFHGPAAGHAGENQVSPDAVVGQNPQLDLHFVNNTWTGH